MAKVFQFTPGSYIDPISGAVGQNNNGSFQRTEKGLAWRGNGSSSWVDLLKTLTGVVSIETSFYIPKKKNYVVITKLMVSQ